MFLSSKYKLIKNYDLILTGMSGKTIHNYWIQNIIRNTSTLIIKKKRNEKVISQFPWMNKISPQRFHREKSFKINLLIKIFDEYAKIDKF